LKIAVFGDIHGNISAFESFVKLTKEVDLHICLGDVVNYCPHSNECVDLLESLPYSIKIKGNHEEAFIKGVYNGNNEISRAFFEYAYKGFEKIDIINKYKDFHNEFGYTFIHTILNSYIYADSKVDLDTNYMIGHSHRQYKITNNNFTLYNPGSIGQNRVNIEEGQYLILDTKVNQVEMKNFPVDIDKLVRELKHLGYPSICTDYFLSKQIKK
jgi:predicted phosphodiesterase